MGGCVKENATIVFGTIAFFLALAITSIYGLRRCRGDWQRYDTVFVRVGNCTCLTESEYQCVQERVRKGLSMHGVECEIIEVPGELKKFELCEYKSGKRMTHHCYIIENPVTWPRKCYQKFCDAFHGLRLWVWAAKIGAITGIIAIIIMSMLFCFAEERIGIWIFCVTNLGGLAPPPMIAYALIATDVSKLYRSLGLNVWAWIMVIGFGIPLYVGWIYSFQRSDLLLMATTYYQKLRQRAYME